MTNCCASSICRVVALRGSTPLRASSKKCATRSAVSAVVKPTPRCGLCRMARWKRPRVSAVDMRAAIAWAPADSPNTVTRPGSPPKAAMLRCTQRSAAIWSITARFAGETPAILRKPNTPRPVVHAHDDHVALMDQRVRPVPVARSGADDVCAAVEPDHDRAGARVERGRRDAERKAILVLSRRRAPAGRSTMSRRAGSWGQIGPCCVAERTPDQGAERAAPRTATPPRTARRESVSRPPRSRPSSAPLSTVTIGSTAAVYPDRGHAGPCRRAPGERHLR